MVFGGKARSLKKLKDAGFNVPDFIVSTNVDDLREHIRERFPGTEYFAVRSSAEGEDAAHESFAGRFHSFVGLTIERVPQAMKDVIDSYGGRDGSVIVQRFIPSITAGVLFTDVGNGTTVVNASAGLCTSVVGGKACDEYTLSDDGKIIQRTIADEKTAQVFEGGIVKNRVIHGEVLAEENLRELLAVGKRIERFFGRPQDIEWCYLEGELFVLQSRPITRQLTSREPEYYDSANIAESYSGMVLPLTYTFARRVYRQVYRDFLHMSGVPRSQLEEHAYVFDGLLGIFQGRMFYNMNNWYRMAQFVPGYERNKTNFELMITSNIRGRITNSIRPKPFLALIYPCIVLVKVLFFGITRRRFKRYVEDQVSRMRRMNIDSIRYVDCVKLISDLESTLLRRWYVTLENDFFVMTYLGLLQKFLPEKLLKDAIRFKSKASEQLIALASLGRMVNGVGPLWEAVIEGDAKRFTELMSTHPQVKESLGRYLDTFGGRFANELKLETIGLDEDTEKLLRVLAAFARYTPPVQSDEDAVRIDLPFHRKILFKLILSKFKKYAAQREVFRLLRSNMFAITRSIVRRAGRLLAAEGLLEHHDDVFYLPIEELVRDLETIRSEPTRLKCIVASNRENYMKWEHLSAPSHFILDQNTQSPISTESNNHNKSGIRGVSSGIVRGRVKVMKEFSMPETIDFDILVASHTDPGWTALIALSKGLIIEHGGVLSHASIIARELGIPAVIGVAGATDEYVDGDIVELNGSNGTITRV